MIDEALSYGPAWTGAAAAGIAFLFTRYAKREHLLGVMGGESLLSCAPRGVVTSDSGQGPGTDAPRGCGHESPATQALGPGRTSDCRGGRL